MPPSCLLSTTFPMLLSPSSFSPTNSAACNTRPDYLKNLPDEEAPSLLLQSLSWPLPPYTGVPGAPELLNLVAVG